MGRREARRHVEEAVTGLGDSLEKEVRGKENNASQGEGLCEESSLDEDSGPYYPCDPKYAP